jgi:SAM-dependent methyltransferase
MHPKEFYRNYLADDESSDLTNELIFLIRDEDPVHVLEFGCGTGKNLVQLEGWGICPIGIDISFINVATAKLKHGISCIVCADESYLRNFVNIDVVFTVSVLDHIEDVDGIIQEFKRIANKAVFLAETNDVVAGYYYQHNYESYGFKKLEFQYTGEDGASYYIWKWENKPAEPLSKTVYKF